MSASTIKQGFAIFALAACVFTAPEDAFAQQRKQTPSPLSTVVVDSRIKTTEPQQTEQQTSAPPQATTRERTTTAPRTGDDTNGNDANDATEEKADNETAAREKSSEMMRLNRRGAPIEEEEARAILPYYNNFMATYRLGPEDIISIEVFNQPRYSRGNITIPPTGKISYHLIKDGINVAGKTTTDIERELERKLDEYIIDPGVTVTIEKVGSARYSILGDVAQPGVRLMTRRLSVREAIGEAGGVLDTGNKSKIKLIKAGANGISTIKEVNLAKIEKGKVADDEFLDPGDQIVVPGNVFKTIDKVSRLLSVVSFARIFTGF